MTLIVTDVAHRGDDFDLDPQIIGQLWRMEERHFWHRARNRWIAKALVARGIKPSARILEVGCGSGAVSRFLQRRGYRVTGVDTAEPLVRKAEERCPEATFIVGDVTRLNNLEQSFDAICFFDVLEHLSNPMELIAGCCRHAHQGTLFIATVPALRSLHSVVDDLSGHKRRYEPSELSALFQDAGFQDIEERGIFRAVTPILRGFRSRAHFTELGLEQKRAIMLANLNVPWRPLDFLLGAVCDLERWFGFKRARGRAGASVLAIGCVP